ncbi:DUF2975 domain-containing protein [Chitinophaga pollutisoli]|uniref:DUF2975 domain-containing protein n=1 Tax=Chitinophaga pollutisoli TaxID=3133966 RepID=A0ABZ2YQM8_9BACT
MPGNNPSLNGRIFHTFRWLVEIAWYTNFALIAIAITILSLVMFFDTDTHFSAMVDLTTPLSSIPATGATLEAKAAIIHMRVPINTFQQISAFFFLFLFEFIVIAVLFNLRKVLRSIKRQSPFTNEAIRRLRYTALFIALLAPYNLLLSILRGEIIHAYAPQAEHAFRMHWNIGLPYIIVAAVIYILVDVFRYGMRLQKENEAFV